MGFMFARDAYRRNSTQLYVYFEWSSNCVPTLTWAAMDCFVALIFLILRCLTADSILSGRCFIYELFYKYQYISKHTVKICMYSDAVDFKDEIILNV